MLCVTAPKCLVYNSLQFCKCHVLIEFTSSLQQLSLQGLYLLTLGVHNSAQHCKLHPFSVPVISHACSLSSSQHAYVFQLRGVRCHFFLHAMNVPGAASGPYTCQWTNGNPSLIIARNDLFMMASLCNMLACKHVAS